MILDKIAASTKDKINSTGLILVSTIAFRNANCSFKVSMVLLLKLRKLPLNDTQIHPLCKTNKLQDNLQH